jgi:citrate synthase
MLDVPAGLEGVVVDETAISEVDGTKGDLSYRGYHIDDLVSLPFTEVAGLVLTGSTGVDLEPELASAAHLSERETQMVLSIPDTIHPMNMLQGMVPLLDETDAFDRFGDAAHGLTIAAKLPALIATFLTGESLNKLSNTNYIHRFLSDIKAPTDAVHHEAFEVTQILQIEHSFNASTFTARVVESTEAPIQNALSAAIGTLHGRLHGGADQAALEAADSVPSPGDASAFVDRCIKNGIKIMGMGHREYKILDPRARHIKRIAESLTRGTEHEQTYLTLKAIEDRFTERMAEKNKPLYANVEFYKGVVFRALGMPTRFFTTGFAMARVFGYIAHFVEARQNSKLIRPAAAYVGPPVGSRPAINPGSAPDASRRHTA